MEIKIFVLTHKKFDEPHNPIYQPLHVGRAISQPLGYLGDDSGDNISHLNCYYSELTGLYWIWKNYSACDYIGTCHYRRYLINSDNKVFTKEQYIDLLSEYDLITTLRVQLNNSYYYGFSSNHNVHILDTTGEVIRDLYPDYYDKYLELVTGNETYFGNMFVTSHELFNKYCHWLFSIFEEVSKRTCLENGEDDYHKRVFGFISEFLLFVFVNVNNLKVCECKVAMIGEKAETRELKEALAELFVQRNIRQAKETLLNALKKRPDLMMEASDITGELHLCMQIISTCEFEIDAYNYCILDYSTDFRYLCDTFGHLNALISNGSLSEKAITDTNRQWLIKNHISDIALSIAMQLYVK